MAELRWAPPRREDDQEWAGLLAAIEAVDERGETYELADLADEWASVWSHPEENARFLWDGSSLVAFVWLGVRPGQREAHKITQWGGVHPDRRREGIGTELFDWSRERADAIAKTFDRGLAVKHETDVAVRQPDLLAVAEGAGFTPVRTFLEIARPTSVPVPDVGPAPAVESVPWSDELDEGARLAHVDSFADHWGSEPRTVEEWSQWYSGHRNFRPDLSRLAVDPDGGEVVALVLTAAYPQDWATGPVEAWINTVGTRRSWRGRGVAGWLMTDVLRRIAAAEDGFARAILGVDADNPTGALRLYRRLGFDDDVRSVTSLSRTARP